MNNCGGSKTYCILVILQKKKKKELNIPILYIKTIAILKSL